jgi:hypothetical protein
MDTVTRVLRREAETTYIFINQNWADVTHYNNKYFIEQISMLR